MKKILVTGMSPVLAGTETFIMTYYRNLDPKQIQMDFLVITDQKIVFEDEILANGSKIYRFLPRRSKNLKQYYMELDKLFKSISGEYDILWINRMQLVNIDYFKYAKKYGIGRRIMHSHSSKWSGNFTRRIMHEINKRNLSTLATDFFACSEMAADFMYSGKLRSKAVVINNAIDMEHFLFNSQDREKIRNTLGWGQQKIIGNVGRMSHEKNQPFLIDIFNEAYQQDKTLRLVLLGSKASDDNTEEIVKDKIREYNLGDVVKLVGSQSDIRAWLSAMDLYVMTSKFEGLPLSAVEAQANGLPIILSEAITKETKINNNLSFISLDAPKEEWVKEMLKKLDYQRISKTEIMTNFDKKGFDIKTYVKIVERLLSD